MVMPTCETCRHWANDYLSMAREHGSSYGYCRQINFSYQQNRSRLSPPLASLYDQGGDDATLATMPDFGCVMHEPDPDGDVV